MLILAVFVVFLANALLSDLGVNESGACVGVAAVGVDGAMVVVAVGFVRPGGGRLGRANADLSSFSNNTLVCNGGNDADIVVVGVVGVDVDVDVDVTDVGGGGGDDGVAVGRKTRKIYYKCFISSKSFERAS